MLFFFPAAVTCHGQRSRVLIAAESHRDANETLLLRVCTGYVLSGYANRGFDSPSLTAGLYVYIFTVFSNIQNICCLQPGVSSLEIQLEVGDGKNCKTQDL